MSRFNLIDEKWIPVRFLNGKRDELGIRDTLLLSKEIAVIEDQSPLVVAALHRFLLAVLYRALEGPTDIDQAKTLFREGFPSEKISSYLEKWRDRFWLFDEKYPFGQIPGYVPKEWKAWTKLAAEHNADNAKVLFDHVEIKNAGSVSLSAVARWMLAIQTFDLAVAKSELRQPLDAPSARAILFIALGRDLHDTLCFCLKAQGTYLSEGDMALWELEPDGIEKLKAGSSRAISGYAGLYTWRSRTVVLRDEDSSDVRQIGFASGVTKAGDGLFIDPMVCYQKSQEHGLVQLKFRDEKEFWREFDSLLPGGDNQAPQVIENAVLLSRNVKGRWPIGILVCGQKTKSGQAKIDFWRTSLFTLPQALAGRLDVKSFLRSILANAEDAANVLEAVIWKFYRHILVRDGQKNDGKLRKEEKSQIKIMVGSAAPIHVYWASLERSFHDVLSTYSLEKDADDIRRHWLTSVQTALAEAWNQHRISVSGGDVWAIRALVKSEAPVLRKLKELSKEILKLEPQKESI